MLLLLLLLILCNQRIDLLARFLESGTVLLFEPVANLV